MLLTTECYHQFHISCFKKYLKKRLIEPKSNQKNGEVNFCDPICLRCNKVIGQEDINECLTKPEMDEIEQLQMDARIEFNPNLFKCVECNSTISFEPSKPDYKQKDDKGQVLTKQAAEHAA